ncbi:enkurin [Cyclopterus lumpus]|uniref:Enkurin, TRPC channel interacting protein n=1 Tax=Cyclopterus lumpus TaxID=8103 RepID=A0A8C3GC71_CYCLU|nr:enkurin [Cyclopterus lumpus]
MSGVVFPPESVHNFMIPKEEVHTQTSQRYMSKYRPTVVLENKSAKDAMRTMGPAKVEVPSPERYLKKHCKEDKLEKTPSPKDVRHACAVKKPAVPVKTDNPPMGLHTKRDFTRTATAVPMRPRPACVDARNGHKQLLENSGLVPEYIKKKQYGEVPEYLQQRNEEERRARERYHDCVTQQRQQGAMKLLSEEERRATLEGLKKSWDKLHRDYQSLSLVTDTLSKKARRCQLEVELNRLEDDINRFERFKTIYISSN